MMYSHPESTLSRLRRSAAALRANLHNQGLTMPGCDAAYRGALFAGASAEEAWEAARQHMLIELSPDLTPTTQTQALYRSGAMDDLASHRRIRAEQIARVRALPNPFTTSTPRTWRWETER